jgi:hypothetical protein
MALTFSEIETLYDAAQAAMAAEAWSSAISKLMQLQACLAATPNASRGSSGGNQAYTFNPQGINDLINQCRKEQAAKIAAASTTGPFQTSKVTYARATE